MSMLYSLATLLVWIGVCYSEGEKETNTPECRSKAEGCRGLIIVDVQNDFMLKQAPGGRLSAFDDGLGDKVNGLDAKNPQNYKRPNPEKFKKDTLGYIEKSLEDGKYDFIVYSIDYHPGGKFANEENKDGEYHCSFTTEYVPGTTTDKCKNTQIQFSWPPHCMQGDNGAKLVAGMPYPSNINRRYVIPTHGEPDNNEKALKGLKEATGEKTTDFSYNSKYAAFDQIAKFNEFQKNPKSANFEIENGNAPVWKHFLGNVFDGKINSVKNKKKVDVFFIFKGMNYNVDSYSAFQGNNGEASKTPLHATLEKAGYKADIKTKLDTLGVAYDFCVKFTAMDAFKLGYRVEFLGKYSAPILDYDQTDKELTELSKLILSSKYPHGAEKSESLQDNNGPSRRLLSPEKRKRLDEIKAKLVQQIWGDSE